MCVCERKRKREGGRERLQIGVFASLLASSALSARRAPLTPRSEMLVPGAGRRTPSISTRSRASPWRQNLQHGAEIPQRRGVSRPASREEAEGGLRGAGGGRDGVESRRRAAHRGRRGYEARQHLEQAALQHLGQEAAETQRFLPTPAEFPIQCAGETAGMGVHLSRLRVSSCITHSLRVCLHMCPPKQREETCASQVQVRPFTYGDGDSFKETWVYLLLVWCQTIFLETYSILWIIPYPLYAEEDLCVDIEGLILVLVLKIEVLFSTSKCWYWTQFISVLCLLKWFKEKWTSWASQWRAVALREAALWIIYENPVCPCDSGMLRSCYSCCRALE